MRCTPVAVALLLFAGCAPARRVEGLSPIGPLRREPPSVPTVNSLQPTLTWEPFPTNAPGVRVLGYDLRILTGEATWLAGTTVGGAMIGGTLVYARDGLPEPTHMLETALESKRTYVWTVRARLEVDGAARVSQWTRLAPRRPIEAITMPDRNYFSFRTPRRRRQPARRRLGDHPAGCCLT